MNNLNESQNLLKVVALDHYHSQHGVDEKAAAADDDVDDDDDDDDDDVDDDL